MSAKQLRKLRELAVQGAEESHARSLAEDAAAPAGEEPPGPQHASDEPEAESAPPRRPGFAALGESSSSDEEQDEVTGSDAEIAGTPSHIDPAPAADDSESAAPSGDVPSPDGDVPAASGAARRRRKASAKGAGRAPAVQPAAKEAVQPAAEEEQDEDDALLDAAAREVQELVGDEPATAAEAAESAAVRRVLTMRRADFCTDTEWRKAVGREAGARADGGARRRERGPASRLRGAGEGRTAHHRRLFLVKPTADEQWPRPDDCMGMVADIDADGAAVFDFEETPASSRLLTQLRACLRAQDPQLLQNFLQRNVFCVDGLLVMAQHFRSQQSHEQACQLIRRAVYALECSANPAFSPFADTAVGPYAPRPRVALRCSEEPKWPGWSWLHAHWLHMHALAGQGMHRTALEVCKLLLAASLPRDPAHALPVFDFLCLRSKQYDALARFAAHLAPEYGFGSKGQGPANPRVDLAMPGFAYSLALAGFLKAGSPPTLESLNHVGVADVLRGVVGAVEPEAADGESEEADLAPSGAALHAQLLRAMLIFPLALRPLLDEAGVQLFASAPAGSTSQERWADLLAQPPFADAADFRHSQHAAAHGRLSAVYAKRSGSLWKAGPVQRWLHACAARIVGMHASSVFASELAAARLTWSSSGLCVEDALARDYGELRQEEGSVEAPLLPMVLDQAIQARLHPPLEDGIQGPVGELGRAFGIVPGGRGDPPPPTVSLHTPPLLVFFQCLMPWAEIDFTGVAVEPLTWSDVARGAAEGVRGAAVFTWGLIGDLGRLALMGAEAAREKLSQPKPPMAPAARAAGAARG